MKERLEVAALSIVPPEIIPEDITAPGRGRVDGVIEHLDPALRS